MCFSTTASFSAAAILGVSGIISLKKAQNRSQLMFACIPFLFALQQAIEGFLWIALRNEQYVEYKELLSYLFLFFAHILWTTWVPLSILFLETEEGRKKILKIISVAGIAASIILGYRLFAFGTTVEINNHHIYYLIGHEGQPELFSKLFYVGAILLPPFISSVKRMLPLAILLTGSLLLTILFYKEYLISVWCFFAAVLSIMIVYVLQESQSRTYKQTSNEHRRA